MGALWPNPEQLLWRAHYQQADVHSWGLQMAACLARWEAREHCCCQAELSFAGQHDPTM